MAENFWSNPGNLAVPKSVITLDSPGDLATGPMGSMPGTTAGAVPAVYSTEARTVYPWDLDFTGKELTQYNNFVANRFQEFSSWHSLYQARYIKANGAVSVAGIDPASTRPDAYYILLSDNRTVLNVMSLTVADYQRLSKADRTKLEDVRAFTDFVAVEQNLVSSKTATTNSINALKSQINSGGSMPVEDRNVFTAQVAVLERRLSEATRIVTGNFDKEIGAIASRFQRALTFVSVRDEVGMTTTFQQTERERYRIDFNTDVKGYAYSSDNGETAKKGYTSFMRSEREILATQLRREAIARNTTVYDPKQDAAALIYQLQLQYQSEATARSDAGTEEMAQLHRLLSDYAIIQRLVNETLKAYNPKETDEKRRFMNIGARDDNSIDIEQRLGYDQNFQIRYVWTDGWQSALGADGSNQNGYGVYYDEAPRYHWYQLAGGYMDSRVGNAYIQDYDNNGIFEGFFDYNKDGKDRGDAYDFLLRDQEKIYVRAGGLTEAEMRIVGMFSKDPWGSGVKKQDHPLETLYGIENRPMQNLTDDTSKGKGGLALQRRDYWDKWSTQLSDTVTILNQKNQLKQNEIDNDSKQANRHFDLGNNALKKMNEMLMSIGRM